MRTHLWNLMFRLGCSRASGRWLLPVLLACVLIAAPALAAPAAGGQGLHHHSGLAVAIMAAPRTPTPVAAAASVEATASTGYEWLVAPPDVDNFDAFQWWLLSLDTTPTP